MLVNSLPKFLLASHEPALLGTIESALNETGVRVEIVLSAPAALDAMTAPHPPELALLDTKLPGMETERLLAETRAVTNGRKLPIVLITDTVSEEWLHCVTEGVIDDLIPRGSESRYWQLRLDMVLRTRRMQDEWEALREAVTVNAQQDRLTGVLNREAMLAMLFRETDRAQRMNSSLCLVLFDIDDFGHWNSRLGVDACDELLCEVAGRTARLLRSYDVLGRPGMDEFLVALPGCNTANAVRFAERLRLETFCSPYRVGGESIRLSACFGIASSNGRSPIVVLREAEQSLDRAKESGPESIQCFDERLRPAPPPVVFISPASGDELLAW